MKMMIQRNARVVHPELVVQTHPEIEEHAAIFRETLPVHQPARGVVLRLDQLRVDGDTAHVRKRKASRGSRRGGGLRIRRATGGRP